MLAGIYNGKEQTNLRRQERIELEQAELQERQDKHNAYINDF